MKNVIRRNWSAAYCNERFFCLKTYSGYRSGTHADPKGSEYLLPSDASDEALGSALKETLVRSRFVLPAPQTGSGYAPDVEFDPELYDYNLSSERYKNWVNELMRRYGYKTKRALFEKMRNCNITEQSGVITIQPSHHERLDSWSDEGMSEDDYVVIPADSSAAQVGAALRLAFSRCTD